MLLLAYVSIFVRKKCGLHLSSGLNFGPTLRWQIFLNPQNLVFHEYEIRVDDGEIGQDDENVKMEN
jgi:hypothetical protein